MGWACGAGGGGHTTGGTVGPRKPRVSGKEGHSEREAGHGRASPFHEDAGLHSMHDASELGLLLRAAAFGSGLLREGGGQPVPHLRRHSIRPQLLQLILCVQDLPEAPEWGGGGGRSQNKDSQCFHNLETLGPATPQRSVTLLSLFSDPRPPLAFLSLHFLFLSLSIQCLK